MTKSTQEMLKLVNYTFTLMGLMLRVQEAFDEETAFLLLMLTFTYE